MEMTLFGFATLFIALFGVVMVRRSSEPNEKVKFSQLILVIVGAVLLIVALTIHAFAGEGFGQLELLTILLSLIFGLIGFWKMFSSEKPFSSHGFLGLGTAIIVIVASFAIPIYSQNLPESTSSLPIALHGSSTSPDSPVNLSQLSNLLSNSSSPESGVDYPIQANMMLTAPTPVVTAQAIPTLEPPVLFFSSPTPIPEVTTSCTAVVSTNLNLRDLPSTSAGAVIGVMNENIVVELIGVETNGEWFYMQTDNNAGWLFGDLLVLDETCNRLPIRNWN